MRLRWLRENSKIRGKEGATDPARGFLYLVVVTRISSAPLNALNRQIDLSAHLIGKTNCAKQIRDGDAGVSVLFDRYCRSFGFQENLVKTFREKNLGRMIRVPFKQSGTDRFFNAKRI